MDLSWETIPNSEHTSKKYVVCVIQLMGMAEDRGQASRVNHSSCAISYGGGKEILITLASVYVNFRALKLNASTMKWVKKQIT